MSSLETKYWRPETLRHRIPLGYEAPSRTNALRSPGGSMKTLRLLLAASMLLGAHAVMAQAPTPANAKPHKGQSNGEIATAKNSVPCQHIITECKKLGFVAGQYQEDNGLWKDCFNPVVKGGQPTRENQK